MADRPSDNDIARAKAACPDRALRLVELTNEDDELCFIVSGPSKPEYQKFQEEAQSAVEKKSDKERAEAARQAIERAALAQIKWPDRDAAQALFVRYPSIYLKFADLLHDMAGDSFEVRSKKL